MVLQIARLETTYANVHNISDSREQINYFYLHEQINLIFQNAYVISGFSRSQDNTQQLHLDVYRKF